jgi:hypothetical protein
MSQSHTRRLLAAGILSASAILAAAPPAFAGDDEGAAGAVSPLAPPAARQGGSSQGNPQRGGVGGFSGRFSAYERNAPDREDRTHINVGNEHVNAIFGGIGQGGGVGLGVQLTTADDIPGVELSAAAIVSTKLYRQLEADAYFPSVGGEDTHADVRFRYRRRTKDNFFGIGPDVGPTALNFEIPGAGPVFIEIPPSSSEDYETNYDLEQRQTSASLFHDFTDRFQAGVYVQYVSSSVYEGQDDADLPIGTFFVPFGVPVFTVLPPPTGGLLFRFPVPGLFTGSKILSEGAYAEFDARTKDEGLPQGFYAYARVANHDGLGEIDRPPTVFPFPFPVIPGFDDFFPSNLNDFGWVNFTLKSGT